METYEQALFEDIFDELVLVVLYKGRSKTEALNAAIDLLQRELEQ